MSNQLLDIGLEIKILRERLKISSKDLAQRVGLSQSQMSRLEKGQRRIDIRILHKISEALSVDPSFFFRNLDAPDGGEKHVAQPGVVPAIAPPIRYDQIGKLVRSERRKRHLTVDELASKVGRTKAYMIAFEEGRHGLAPDLADRIARALRVSPNFFIEAQEERVRALEAQVARLDQALAEAHRGRDASEGDPTAAGESADVAGRKRSVPLFNDWTTGSLLFDSDGQPVGEPEDFLRVPGFDVSGAFAVTVVGDAMTSTGSPSFREGDIVVFSPARTPRSRDLALVRLADESVLFRQIFFEPEGASSKGKGLSGRGAVRLQPLNLDHPARSCPRQNVVGLWALELHVARA